jgi:broad specificity phosphatase PhoE
MSHLILIRHVKPVIDEYQPSVRWLLSDAGRQASRRLGERLRPYALDVMVTSHEPKAAATGEIAASVLGIPVKAADGLGEHLRENTPWYDDPAVFKAKVRECLQKPDQVVFGDESADAAYDRFAAAVDAVVAAHPDQNIAVATHGTVMSLFIARRAGGEAIDYWLRWGLPAFAVLDLPTFTLREVVADV